jgi:hypothetical protein
MLYAGGLVALVLLPLFLFTYAYHLALVIVVLTLFLFGLWISKKPVQFVTGVNFELSREGDCSFKGNELYQLQESSRLSFLGCWLILQPKTPANSIFNNNKAHKNKTLFIYRDSLSKQDLSRLANVIAQLNHQP